RSRDSRTVGLESRGPSAARPQRRDRRHPAVLVLELALDRAEESLLDALRNRPAAAGADGLAVDAADRGELARGAGEEQLVRRVQHLARQPLLDHRDRKVARDLDDARARDAGEDRRADGRREEAAVLHEEEVLAAAFADVALDVEDESFVVPVTA